MLESGVPLSYVICPEGVDPAVAPDEYTSTLWAASFNTQYYRDDNLEVYHLFKDLLIKTDGAPWFEKVKDGEGHPVHLLLREHYVGEAHMHRAASTNTKLEALLFWKNEASIPFDKNGFNTTKHGMQILNITTTKGWQLLCQWKGASSDWIDLKDLKDSNQLELAEYPMGNQIQEEPSFKWWEANMLQTRNRQNYC